MVNFKFPWQKKPSHLPLDEENQAKPPETTWSRIKAQAIVIYHMLPYLWPKGSVELKVRVMLALGCLIGAKTVNILSPFAYKAAVDALTNGQAVPVTAVILYSFAAFSKTSLDNLRETFFNKVSLNAHKRAALDTFTHLHGLSLSYHLQRKTGVVLRAVDRGTTAISFITTFLMFNIVPILFEIGAVCIVLLSNYSAWFALITFSTMMLYIAFTVGITEWRTKFRREMNEKESDSHNKAVDSLLNFETVKYFNAERHEISRYSEALDNFVAANQKSQFSLAFLNVGQGALIALGQFAVMMLAAYLIVSKTMGMSVGDFVLVNTYIVQLYMPLNFLGTSYRMIKQSLIDMEKMFEVLQETPEVVDTAQPIPLSVPRGEIVFENVEFNYKNLPSVLKGVSFTVPSGKTLAIVGPSGAGKSTILRLLFRFYDAKSGRILIDGTDITQVKQTDLREKLGIVPQDTVLFNDTIRYNVQYGRRDATDDEVREAARVANILDMIESLPEKWDTVVGERGLRLSGGEKQRVSIARAVLKNPPIMVFDEATSALDTHTEKEIQDNLRTAFKGKTTTITLAHRLSTIVDSDEIIVLKNGVIHERGTHEQLIQLADGEYKKLWDKQIESQREAERKAKLGPNAADSDATTDADTATASTSAHPTTATATTTTTTAAATTTAVPLLAAPPAGPHHHHH